jgi:hypothetical protein
MNILVVLSDALLNGQKSDYDEIGHGDAFIICRRAHWHGNGAKRA